MLSKNAKVYWVSSTVVALTLVIVGWYVNNHLDLLQNPEIPFGVVYTTAMSALVSAVLYSLAALVLRIPWRGIRTVLVIMVSTMAVLGVTVALLPGRDDYVSNVILHREPLYRYAPKLLIGNITPEVVTGIRAKLPSDVYLYMVDGTQAQRGEYWVEVIDGSEPPGSDASYKLCVFNQDDNYLCDWISISQMWDEVRQDENLASDAKYISIYGLPTKETGNPSEDLHLFTTNRTVYFRTAQGAVYGVKLTFSDDTLSMSMSVTKVNE